MKHSHTRQSPLAFHWPSPPLSVALVEPEIPPNTGNIARLCAATQSPLHLVGKTGFRLTDSQVRRAGLDYWDSVALVRHATLSDFETAVTGQRLFFFSTRGQMAYTAATYRPGDVLVFGSESKGLPDDLLDRYPDHVLTIPMQTHHVRSLNLATAVGIVLYEALRQINASSSCNGNSDGIQ